MNKIHSKVWNKELGQLVVASEFAKSDSAGVVQGAGIATVLRGSVLAAVVTSLLAVAGLGSTALAQEWTVTDGANPAVIGDGDTVTFQGDSNINVAQTGSDGAAVLAITLDPDLVVDSVTADEVTTGTTVMNNNGVAVGANVMLGSSGLVITGGPSVTIDGINAGNEVITNVAAGGNASDAVNFGQLGAVSAELGVAQGAIANNAAAIATNTTNVATNTVDIATNADDIATNVTDISVNTADIAINTANIATNADEIESVRTTASAGWDISAENGATANVGSGGSVDFSGDGNIEVARSGTDLAFSLADDIEVQSITAGSAALGSNGLTIDGGPSVTSAGIDAGGLAITNMASGEVAEGSMEAITGGQIYNYFIEEGATGVRYFRAASTQAPSEAEGAESIAIGPNTVSTGASSFAAGDGAETTEEGEGAIALGQGAVAGGVDEGSGGAGAIAIGREGTASGNSAVALGDGASASAGNATALGAGAVASGGSSIALGQAQAVAGNSFAAGTGAFAGSPSGIALGTGAGVGTHGTEGGDRTSHIAIGTGAGSNVVGNQTTAIGYEAGSNVEGLHNVAIGSHAGANLQGNYNVAIGHEANRNAGEVENATAVGGQSDAGRDGVATGYGAQALDTGTALGSQASAGEGGVALGRNATAEGSHVAIGIGSAASGSDAQGAGYLTGSDFTDGQVVSVGNASLGGEQRTRRIVNVADGAQGYDAVNVRQLHGAQQAVANLVGGNVQLESNGAFGGYVIALEDTDGVVHEYTTVAQAINAVSSGEISVLPGNAVIYNGEGGISNVSAGVLGTDAVNLEQLNAAIAEEGVKYFSVNSEITGNRNNASASAIDAIAVGPAASAGGRSSLAAGHLAHTVGNRSTALGYEVEALGDDSTVVGSSSTAYHDGGVAIGLDAESHGENSIVMGTRAHSHPKTTDETVDNAIVIGTDAEATADNGIAIGESALASEERAVAQGFDAHATADDAMAFGTDSRASAQSAQASGTNANASGVNAQASGTNARAIGYNTIASGTGATGYATNGIAMGTGAVTGFDDPNNLQLERNTAGIAIGNASLADGQHALALGVSASAEAESATAIGDDAEATGVRAFAAGTGADASAEDALAVGSGARATEQNASAFGQGAEATHVGSVALGSDAVTADAVGTAQATIDNVTYDYAGIDPVATVSVGAPGQERTITNVAAGRVDAGSTDAINGSQLFQTNTAVTALGNNLDTAGGSVADVLGGNAAYDPDTHQVTMSDVGGTGADTVDEAIEYAAQGWDVSAQGGTAENVAPGGTVDFSNTDNNIEISRDGTDLVFELADEINVDSLTAGDTVVDGTGVQVGDDVHLGDTGLVIEGGPSVTAGGIDAGGSVISNVGPGDVGTDAVNVNQLNTLAETPLTFAGDTGTNVERQLGETVNLVGGAAGTLTDGNIGVVADGNATLSIQLAENIDLGEDGSVGIGDTTVDNDGLTVDDGAGNETTIGAGTVTIAANPTTGPANEIVIDANTGTIGGLTNLDFDPDNIVSGQAATEDQLGDVYDVANAGWNLTGEGEDLVNIGPNGAVDFQGDDNITVAQSGVDQDGVVQIALNRELDVDSVTAGDSVLDTDGLVVTDDEGNITTVAADGSTVEDDAGNATTVAAGDVTVTNGDASTSIGAGVVTVAGGTNTIVIDGDAGTIGGLTNTTFDPDNFTSGQAATEDQLSQVSTDLTSAGLDFVGDDGETVHRDLGETLSITGGADPDALSEGNIGVTQNADEDGLLIELADNIELSEDGSLAIGDGTDGSTLDADGLVVVGDDGETTVDAGSVAVTDADGTTTSIGGSEVIVGGDSSITISGDTGTIEGLANVDLDGDDFAQAGRAATEEQLDLVNQAANAGWNLTDTDGNQVNIGPDGLVTFEGDQNISVAQTGDDQDGVIEVALNRDLDLDSVTVGDTYIDNAGVAIGDDVHLGDTGLVITGGPSVTVDGINAGDLRITNVEAGVDGTDAVNVDQLNALGNTPLTFAGDAGDNVDRLLGQTVNLVGGADEATLTEGNIGVVADGTDTLEIKLNKDVDLGEDGSVAIGNTTANNDGLVVDDGAGNATTIEAGTMTVAANPTTGPANEIVIDANTGTIGGLTNTDFDPEADYTGGVAATQEQLSQVNNNLTSAGLNFVGDDALDVHRDLGDTLSITGGADLDALSSGNIGITRNADEDGLVIELADNIELTEEGSLAIGDGTDGSTLDADGLVVVDGDNRTEVEAGMIAVADVGGETVIGGNYVSVGGDNPIVISGDAGTIGGLTNLDFDPDNIVSGQAATEDQLGQVYDVANAGWDVSAQGGDATNVGVNSPTGNAVDLNNSDDNIVITKADDSNDVTFDLAENIDLGENGSLTTGNTVVDNNGVAVDDGAGNVANLTVDGASVTDADGNVTTVAADGTTVEDDAGNVTTVIADGATVADADGNSTAVGAGTVAVTDGTGTTAIGGNVISVGGNNPIVISGDTGTIGGLTNLTFDPDNIVSGQAATEDQLGQVYDVANAGWDVSAQGENATNVGVNSPTGNSVDLNNSDDNIVITKADDSNDVTFDLAENIDLGEDGSLTTGNTVVDNSGVAVDDGAGNVANLTVDGASVTDADGNVTTLAADGTTVEDDAGNVTTVVADGTTVADVDGNNTAIGAGTVAVTDGTGTTTIGGSQVVVGGGSAITIDGDVGTIGGLSNTTFDPDAIYTGGVAATQEQLSQVNNDLTSAGLDFVGDDGQVVHRDLGEQLSITGGATGALSEGNIGVTRNDDEDGLVIELADNIELSEDGSLAIGDGTDGSVLDADGLAVTDGDSSTTIGAGSIGVVDADGNTTTIGGNVVSVGGDNPIVISGDAGTIGGLTNLTFDPDNIVSGQAATEDQLGQVYDVANAGWDVSAQGENATNVGLNSPTGNAVDLNNADGNIVITKADDSNDVTFDLAENIDLGEDGSITIGDTLIEGDSITTTNLTVGGTTQLGDNFTVNEGGVYYDGPITEGDHIVNKAYVDGAVDDLANTPLTFAGDAGDNVDRLLGETVNLVGGATDEAALTDGNIGVVADGTDTLEIKLNKDIDLGADGSVAIGSTTVDNGGLTVAVATGSTTVGAGFVQVVGAGGTVMIDGNTGTIGGLTNTTFDPDNFTSGQAATEDQLSQVHDVANAGWNLTGSGEDQVNIGPNGAVDFQGDQNITVAQTGEDQDGVIEVTLNRDLDLDSVTAGDTFIDNSGVAIGTDVHLGNAGLVITGGPSVTVAGINAGNMVITNVAPGEISATSTDAVNGSQLHGMGDSITTVIGGNAELNPDGTIVTSDVGGTGHDNIDDAIRSANDAANAGWTATDADGNDANIGPNGSVAFTGDDNISVAQTGDDNSGEVEITLNRDLDVDSITAGDTVIDTDGVQVGDDVHLGDTGLVIEGGPSVTTDGIDAGDSVISNVAAGVEDTDAANVGQLNQVSGDVSDLDDRVTNVEGDVEDLQAGATGPFQVSQEAPVVAPTPTGANSAAGGSGADASGDNSTALGNQAVASGANSTAVGQGAEASHDNSVALGQGSATTVGAQSGYDAAYVGSSDSAGEVNVGNRTISGVAPGMAGDDAVNVNQLNSGVNHAVVTANAYTDQRIDQVQTDVWQLHGRVDELERDINAGVATAMAMRQAPYVAGATTYYAGFGTYKGEGALGISLRRTADNGRWSLEGGFSGNRDGAGGYIGVSGVLGSK